MKIEVYLLGDSADEATHDSEPILDLDEAERRAQAEGRTLFTVTARVDLDTAELAWSPWGLVSWTL